MSEQLPDALQVEQPENLTAYRDAAVDTASDTSQELFSAAHSETADWADADENQGHESEFDETARHADANDTTTNDIDQVTSQTMNTPENVTALDDSGAEAPNDQNADPPEEQHAAPAEPGTEKATEQDTNLCAQNTESQTEPQGAADGDFDDFGDFEEGDFEEAPAPAPVSEPEPTGSAVQTMTSAPADPGANPLKIDGGSSESISTQIHELLPPEFGPSASELGQEDIRQVEGITQVLVTESSRTLLRELQAGDSLPSHFLNWKRSQTRRQQLLALGVPINLDEVLGGGAQKPELPPLELHVETEQKTAPTFENSTSDTQEAQAPPQEPAPVAPAERLGDRRRRELGVSVPVVDNERIEQITRLSEDDLKLQSLPALRSLVKELQTLSAQTTELLAYHLMLRDMFSADSEMYNAMIKDLVAGASSRVASRRRGSLGFIGRSSRPGTPTGRNTPT